MRFTNNHNLCKSNFHTKRMSNKKQTLILFRIEEKRKEKWKQICKNRNIPSLTSLIIDSVEGRIFESEKRELLTFIEKQDNIFLKIENNINQYARYANTKKFINTEDLKLFNQKLSVIAELKLEQNKMFEKIYHLIGK